MLGRESKEPSSIEREIVNRGQTFTKLCGRRTDDGGESQKARV